MHGIFAASTGFSVQFFPEVGHRRLRTGLRTRLSLTP
jgi:hypothetical protein